MNPTNQGAGERKEEEMEQEEFNLLMEQEKPIVSELNGKKIYFFKNSVWRDKEKL